MQKLESEEKMCLQGSAVTLEHMGCSQGIFMVDQRPTVKRKLSKVDRRKCALARSLLKCVNIVILAAKLIYSDPYAPLTLGNAVASCSKVQNLRQAISQFPPSK